jgi:excisionase family DNA binding protein
MAKKPAKMHALLDGRSIDLGVLDARQRSFLADLHKMRRQAVSYFEIYRAAIGPGSQALAGNNRVHRKIAASDLYQVARDIATRAGIAQGLVLAPEHEAPRATPRDATTMISVTQAAEVIGITRAAVYKAIEKGSLRARHIGNVTVVERASALAYRAGRNEAAAGVPRSMRSRSRTHSPRA